MKKVLKITGIFALILIVGIVVLIKFLANIPNAPEGYQKTVKTGGRLEQKYMDSGDYTVSYCEEKVLQGFGKYVIYYPASITDENAVYPAIVLCNGTGVPISKYAAVAKHFASWGFIVIGTEEEYDWNGFAAEMCVRYLELLSENKTVNGKENIFYKKIDLENVGIAGHSQGGVGVINAVTTQQHSGIFKAAVSVSPTNKQLAQALQWDYDAAQIAVPIMLISGAGSGDDWVVTGEQLKEIYGDIGANKVMLRRKDTPHGETLYSANGYVVAWFVWLLQGDEEAEKAFLGSNAEIISNELYQDQQVCFDNAAG